MAWRFATGRDVALVYDAHEDITLEIPLKAWIPRPLRRVILAVADRVEQWGLRRCTLAIAADDLLGDRLASYAPRVVVVRNYPLSAGPSAVARSDSQVRAIYVGGLSENRGILELVRAMAIVETAGLQLHLFGTFSDGWARDVGPGPLPEGKVAGALDFSSIMRPILCHTFAMKNAKPERQVASFGGVLV